MKVKEERATSVSHVEFEILNELIETVDLESLKQIMAAMGPLTIMMEAFTGVVMARPSKKNNWLVVTPKAAQRTSLKISALGRWCIRVDPDHGSSAQKRRAAPVTRNWINARGGTAACIAFLAMRKEAP